MQVKAILFDCFGVLCVSRSGLWGRSLVLNQDLLDLTQTLKPKYKIGLFSNMSAGVMHKYFTQDQLVKYFDGVVISGEVGMAKPQQGIYELGAKSLGLTPEECVLVDDSAANCEGARQAGMKAVLYNSLDQTKQDLTDILNK